MDWTDVAGNIQVELFASFKKDVERKAIFGDILNFRA
jgi:hypothetical protein